MNQFEVKLVPIDSLHFDPSNARLHPDRNLDAISASLATFGQVEPLVVQKGTGRVISGNGRMEVMKKRGDTQCWIKEVDIDDTQAVALGIALNRSAELAEWDDETLASLLQSLPQECQIAAGFDANELQAVLDRLDSFAVDEADAPELKDGDRAPIQQMTFTLHDDQVELIKRAMASARDAGPFVDTGNENGNGNALARIAEAYIANG